MVVVGQTNVQRFKFCCSMKYLSALLEGKEGQLLPCLPEVVNETTRRSKLMAIK